MFPTTLIFVDPTCLVSARPGKAVAVQSVGLLRSGSLGHFPELLASVFEHLCFSWTFEGFLHKGWVIDLPTDNALCICGGWGEEDLHFQMVRVASAWLLENSRLLHDRVLNSRQKCGRNRQTDCLRPGSATHPRFPWAHFSTCL